MDFPAGLVSGSTIPQVSSADAACSTESSEQVAGSKPVSADELGVASGVGFDSAGLDSERSSGWACYSGARAEIGLAVKAIAVKLAARIKP